MFNKLKLRAAVMEKGMTLKEVAAALEINPATLHRKMCGETEFSRKEIQEICDLLELDSPMEIFFAS